MLKNDKKYLYFSIHEEWEPVEYIGTLVNAWSGKKYFNFTGGRRKDILLTENQVSTYIKEAV